MNTLQTLAWAASATALLPQGYSVRFQRAVLEQRLGGRYIKATTRKRNPDILMLNGGEFVVVGSSRICAELFRQL